MGQPPDRSLSVLVAVAIVSWVIVGLPAAAISGLYIVTLVLLVLFGADPVGFGLHWLVLGVGLGAGLAALALATVLAIARPIRGGLRRACAVSAACGTLAATAAIVWIFVGIVEPDHDPMLALWPSIGGLAGATSFAAWSRLRPVPRTPRRT